MVTKNDEAVTIQLPKKLVTGNGAEQLRLTVERLLQEGVRVIALDFPDKCYMDSRAIGTLIHCAFRLNKQCGERVRLVGLGEYVRKQLEAMRALDLFEITA